MAFPPHKSSETSHILSFHVYGDDAQGIAGEARTIAEQFYGDPVYLRIHTTGINRTASRPFKAEVQAEPVRP